MENSELSQLRERVLRLSRELSSWSAGCAAPYPRPKVVRSLRPRGAAPAQAPEGWEQKIGGAWLNRLGVVVLLIGLAFLKAAFDHD